MENEEVAEKPIEQDVQQEDTSQTFEEDIVTIGDQEESLTQKEEAPEWIKDLRKNQRQVQRENKELKKKLEELTRRDESLKEVKKPTMEECDYDSDVYDKKIEEYYQYKRTLEEKQKEIELKQKKEEESWGSVLNSYQEKKNSLRVKDYEDAEGVVQDILSETQQGIILQGATNPAIVVYALGKDVKKAKELSEIEDPIKFAFEVGKLETQMKVSKRRPNVEPENIVNGSERISTNNKELEKLEKEAQKTGDYSKVFQYKKNNRK